MSNNYSYTTTSYTIPNPNVGYTLTIQGGGGGYASTPANYYGGSSGSANQYYYQPAQQTYVGTGWAGGTTPNYPGYTPQTPYPFSYSYDNYYYEDLVLISSLSLFMSDIFNGEEKINYKKLDYLFVQHIKEQMDFSGSVMKNVIYNMRMTISNRFSFLFEYFEKFEQYRMKGYLAIL